MSNDQHRSTRSHRRVTTLGWALALVTTLLAAALVAAPAATAQGTDVYISELFYNPDGQDEGHEFIELYNPGPTAVNVSGWSLISGITFTFDPGSVIDPGGFVAVAQDSASFTAVYGFAPTGAFSGALSNSGETIVLTNGLGTTIDQLSYSDSPPWPASADGDGDSLVNLDPTAGPAESTAWVAGTPTPAAANDAGLSVIFDVQRGWYGSTQVVTLRPTVDGATITYNVDGQAVTDQTYTGPIAVPNNGAIQVIQARATLGPQSGAVVTHTYVFKPDTGVPVVATWRNGLPAAPGEDEETRTFEFLPPPSTGLVPVLANAGVKDSTGGIAAGDSDKVFFRGDYGFGTLQADLFGDRYYGLEPAAEIDQLFLRDQHSDDTHLRQIVAHDALLAVGQLSPHGRFVEYYRVGEVEGIRHMQERPEGGFMEAYTGIDKSLWRSWSTHETTPGSGTSNGLGAATMGAPYASWNQVTNAIDTEALVDYLLVQWQAKVSDYRNIKNFRISGPTSANNGDGGEYRFHFFPWDMDLGYANSAYNRQGPAGWGWAGYVSPDYLAHELDDFDEFRLLASDRIVCAYFGDGALTAAAFAPRLEARRAELVAAGGADQSGYVASLLTWIGQRNTWLIDEYRSPGADTTVYGTFRPNQEPWKPSENFDGPLLGDADPLDVSVTNGVLSIAGAAGNDVYYRLDGGDPRTATGTLAPQAIAYNGPVSLTPGQYQVIARSFDAALADVVDQWSPACNDATIFDVSVTGNPGASPGEGLVITELHYNPPAQGPVDGELFEYIELLNTTNAAINLSGFSFSDGIGYVFAGGSSVGAGQTVVLASDALRFETAYGFAPAGDYDGQLADGGETVTLIDAVGGLVDTVTYGDSAPWPTSPDGGGPSLALRDPSSDNALAQAWGASAASAGTPGAPNDVASTPGDVNCDGLLTLADAILVSQFNVGIRSDSGGCPIANPNSQINAAAADITGNGVVNIGDVIVITQCNVGIDTGGYCD